MKSSNEKKYFALLILAIISLFLLYASIPLLGGIAGAAILYVLLKPLYLKFLKKTNNSTASAWLTILISFILIIIPLMYLVFVSLAEINEVISDLQVIEDVLQSFTPAFNYDPSEIMGFVEEHVSDIAGILTNISTFAISNVISVSLNLLVMYLILYFALTENKKMSVAIRNLIPFSEKNSGRLMKEFAHVIKTTFIGNGVASVILGVLLAAGLVLLGFTNFFFLAIIGTIMAFIPIIGIQIIWMPIALYYLITGNYLTAVAILLWGAFLSYVFDGYIRQKVQKKVGEMHPLISLIGMIIGITYFGVVGIIVGPLILTIFVLVLGMFREEYIGEW